MYTPSTISLVWNGSELVPCCQIPLTDRGFRYGMALFESIAVRGGRAEFSEEHLARLETACSKCGWPVERVALKRAGERLGTFSGPALARIYVSAGDGGPADPVTTPRVFVFAEPRALPSARGIRVRVHPSPFLSVLGGLKTANYWANAEALRQARDERCDEALLFNPHDELVSACMANVFLELDGAWVTPSTASGARAGVVREWIMQRQAVTERPIFREEVERATACFLTSCWAGVKPVAALESRALDTGFAEGLRTRFFNHS